MSKHLVHPGVAVLVPLGRRPLDRLGHDRVPLGAVARHHGKQSGKQHYKLLINGININTNLFRKNHSYVSKAKRQTTLELNT